MKKGMACLLAVVLAFLCCACGEDDGENKRYVVGVCQLIQHAALDAATRGFVETLTEELGEDHVTIDVQNASGDSAACATIINSFVSKGVDLIMANASAALEAAANGTRRIPILGTSITEYGAALKLDGFTGTVGGNISGTSDLAPLDQQADMFTELLPQAKKIGLLYCSAEPNSRYQVDKVKEYLEAKGLTCKLYAFSDTNDLSAVCTAACAGSDALYIPTDNTAANATGIIDGICRPAKTPVIAGEAGICKGCGIASLTIRYYDLGVTTAKMAAKVLRGEADIAKMPVEYADQFTKVYNPAICAELGITVPAAYTAVTK